MTLTKAMTLSLQTQVDQLKARIATLESIIKQALPHVILDQHTSPATETAINTKVAGIK